MRKTPELALWSARMGDFMWRPSNPDIYLYGNATVLFGNDMFLFGNDNGAVSAIYFCLEMISLCDELVRL